ncbi:uncharacterized protein C21orf140 homolog [Zophobas morio]|uniref:uncharacterized protein C21orf140 homolog n=1 Tax=Zophobas morio TaxID=2755281 RepID=UPI0030827372
MRWEYITKIRQFREEGRYIVYVDETWYDTHDLVKKDLTDGTENCYLQGPPSRGKRIIILHAGGTDGWMPNGLLLSAKQIKNCSADYHCDMDATLNGDSYGQCQLSFKTIKQNTNNVHKKDDIIHFMRHNDIDIPACKATKKDLLNCIKQLNMPKQYRIDQIAKEHGHIVLRFPPSYCVLNPIELIWSSLKRSIRRNNTTPNSGAQKNYVKHVIDIENSYVSPNFQEFVVHLEDEDNDDDVVDYFFDSDND